MRVLGYMELRDRFGDVYWLGSAFDAPPTTWGLAEEVGRSFAREVQLDPRRLASGVAVDPDDAHAVAAWFEAELDARHLRLWRRTRTITSSLPLARVVEAAPLLSDLSVTERSWIGWEVLDPRGRPVPGIAYELSTADGEIRTGVTDADGRVHEPSIASGACAIRFTTRAA